MRKYLLPALLFILFPEAPAHGQQIDNVDEAFHNARKLACAGEHEAARVICSAISRTAPDYHDVRILKTRTYEWEGQYEQVIPSNREASEFRESIQMTDQKYAFTVSYTHDRFSEFFDPWNSSYLQLSRATRIGSVIGRINTASRFETTGIQPEIDFYPSIADGWYGYLNIGLSSNRLYPDVRLGGELYYSLIRGLEASAGLRQLRYTKENITILTGSLSGYIGNWMITARPYFTPGNHGVSRSLNLFIRRYFSDTDNYLTLRGGYGFSPDERTYQFDADEIFLAESRFIGIEGQASFRYNLLGHMLFDISQQEPQFDSDNFYTRLNLHVRLEYRF